MEVAYIVNVKPIGLAHASDVKVREWKGLNVILGFLDVVTGRMG